MKTIEDLRTEYKEKLALWQYNFTKEIVAKEIHRISTTRFKNPTPWGWIKILNNMRIECMACKGTGSYKWGPIVNGKPSRAGPCFRCASKGFRTLEDCQRNKTYDNHRKIF